MSDTTNVFNFIISANMAVRREAFERVGGFDERLGPGTRCRAAEDPDLVYRIHRTGQTVRYVPRLLVLHDHRRRDPGDVRRLQRNYTISRGAFYLKHVMRGDTRVLRLLYRHTAGLLRRRRDTDSGVAPLPRAETAALIVFGMLQRALSHVLD